MATSRAIPLMAIAFCGVVIAALTQTAVPLGVLLPAILPLGAFALVLLISIVARPTGR